MRHAFLARSFEVEDVVGIVRLNFAQRVKLYDGPAELFPGITLHPVAGTRRDAVRPRPYEPRLGRAGVRRHALLREHGDRPALHGGFNIGEMLDAYNALHHSGARSAGHAAIPGAAAGAPWPVMPKS
jgi:hypothetical protein